MIRISGLIVPLRDEKTDLEAAIEKKLRIKISDLVFYRIVRRSVDARKGRIHFVYTVDAEIKDNYDSECRLIGQDVVITPDESYKPATPGKKKMHGRLVIAGTGPAGLFSALTLAEAGYRPLLIERGYDADSRALSVSKFWKTGELDSECNVQFGEGGAGAFSDGKLTTLIRDPRCRKVLDELVRCGAPEEITYSAKPHVGTDLLRKIVKNIREKIISLGGQVAFRCTLTDIIAGEGGIREIIVNNTEKIKTCALILAIGHSARDTFSMILKRGLNVTPKAFSIGVRIEHPQEMINAAQYKKFAGHPKLGPAEYKFVYHASGGRSAYTFCMCPGGYVINATSEEGCVVTNGMSNFLRDGKNANSALLVGITTEDFESSHPLAGVEFQRVWERKAFKAGGANYIAPAQLVGDFLKNKPSVKAGKVTPTFERAVRFGKLDDCLPDYVIKTLRESIPELNKKLKGFSMPEAVMTGVETRSSSPVRILRDENFESNIKGIYPAGEGAGYAGGIMSAAVDGIRVAEAVIRKFAPE